MATAEGEDERKSFAMGMRVVEKATAEDGPGERAEEGHR